MCTDSSSAAQRPLSTLITAAEEFLRRQQYSDQIVRSTYDTWRTFLQYAQLDPDGAIFSTALVRRFVLDHYGTTYEDDDPHRPPHRIEAGRHAMRILVDFALHGEWRKRGLPVPPPSSDHQQVLEAFVTDWYRRGLSRRALRPCLVRLRQFLLYLEARDLTHTQVTPAVVSAFVATKLGCCQKTVQMIAYSIRTLLRFLYLEGYMSTDWSSEVPRVRLYTSRKIPSVWSRDEVERLLATVDRGSPVGKRDYAILLLVARLGLRVGDIRELRLEHFQWETQRLAFPQAKTGQVVTLPLLDEVGWAVIDYLQHGRPQTKAREVFVKQRPPFEPFGPDNNLYNIVERHRRRAGIPLPIERRRGMHSLRHTLASALLEQQIPLSTIAAILGHMDSRSANAYLKINVEQLRQCALDPEEVFRATE